MSTVTIANLPRITRDELAQRLRTPSPSSLAIIDVRDSDHIGGHIRSSTHVPSSSLDFKIPELIRTLRDKETVVFHCALSQQRGPSAALRYIRERDRILGREGGGKRDEAGEEGKGRGQKVVVLEGGFVKWQEK